MTELRLLLIVPTLAGGGAERCLVNLADGLVAAGASVEIVTLLRAETRFHPADGRVRLTRLDAHRTAESVLPLARILRERRADAVISQLTSANVATALACRLTGNSGRFLPVSHIAYDEAMFLAHGAVRGRMALAAARWAYGGAPLVGVVSEAARASLARVLGLDPDRVRMLPNAVLGKRFETAPRRADLPQIPVLVGCGRLVPHKRFDDMIRAFDVVTKTRPARLVILGEGPERDRLAALAASLGHSASVEFRGFVTDPVVEFAKASVVLVSSEREGLPTVLVEAMAVGCPVVSTDCPTGPAELLADGVGELVPVGNFEALAAAVLKTLAKPTEPTKLWTIASKFSIANSARAYLENAKLLAK